MPTVKIKVKTSDTIVWNRSEFVAELAVAMCAGNSIVIDFLGEGPCIHSLGIEDIIEKLAKQTNYDLTNLLVATSNAVKQRAKFNIKFTNMYHMVNKPRTYGNPVDKNQNLLPFALFVGRSNAPRLDLATHIAKNYSTQSYLTYHFNDKVEFHRDNIGLEDLRQTFGVKDLTSHAAFLNQCPVLLEGNEVVDIDTNADYNPAHQFLLADKTQLVDQYSNFLAEIVCETFDTGDTFFVTEKTWRPIALKTPFVVQGPQWFLKNLKRLGFATFDRWWDEGYSEDPPTHQVHEIKKVIDRLATLSPAELYKMYIEMQPVLDHNYQMFKNLLPDDFYWKLRNE